MVAQVFRADVVDVPGHVDLEGEARAEIPFHAESGNASKKSQQVLDRLRGLALELPELQSVNVEGHQVLGLLPAD